MYSYQSSITACEEEEALGEWWISENVDIPGISNPVLYEKKEVWALEWMRGKGRRNEEVVGRVGLPDQLKPSCQPPELNSTPKLISTNNSI